MFVLEAHLVGQGVVLVNPDVEGLKQVVTHRAKLGLVYLKMLAFSIGFFMSLR